MSLRSLLGGAKSKSAVAAPIYRDIGVGVVATPLETVPLAEVVKRLFAAAALGDDEATRAMLCEHGAVLRSRAAEWMPPPAALSRNPLALRWRQRGIEQLIWRCADQFGQAGWLSEWERLKGG